MRKNMASLRYYTVHDSSTKRGGGRRKIGRGKGERKAEEREKRASERANETETERFRTACITYKTYMKQAPVVGNHNKLKQSHEAISSPGNGNKGSSQPFLSSLRGRMTQSL